MSVVPAALALAVGGLVAIAWALAAVRSTRARLELVADAEHELRGSLAAIGLIAAGLRTADERHGDALEHQLDRAAAALADLEAARGERRPVTRERFSLDRLVRSGATTLEPMAAEQGRRVLVRGGAGIVSGDRHRLAQAIGNLLANALEHGKGDVAIRADRREGRAVVEVVNATRETPVRPAPPGRGRGLHIAARAAHASGGTVAYGGGSGLRTATLALPTRDD